MWHWLRVRQRDQYNKRGPWLYGNLVYDTNGITKYLPKNYLAKKKKKLSGKKLKSNFCCMLYRKWLKKEMR